MLTVAALILVGAGYLAACMVWPFANCLRCDGDGKRRAPTGRTWRTCKPCKGTGQRRRVGTVLLVAARSKGRR